jgi:superfamily II DNA/RNA helicase
VHRVGRTARLGRTGNAVLLLLPAEESYTGTIT